MTGFKKVLSLKDLPPGNATTVKVGKDLVAIYNVGGLVYATQDACVHAYGPLGAGALDGPVITCPWHGWQFNVVKGCAVMSEEIRLVTYDVKVKDNDIFISTAPRPA